MVCLLSLFFSNPQMQFNFGILELKSALFAELLEGSRTGRAEPTRGVERALSERTAMQTLHASIFSILQTYLTSLYSHFSILQTSR